MSSGTSRKIISDAIDGPTVPLKVNFLYDLSELISIPNNPELIMQLSQPTVKYSSNGKLLIESKEDLKKRGLSSPDMADSLAYSFWQEYNLDWLGKI